MTRYEEIGVLVESLQKRIKTNRTTIVRMKIIGNCTEMIDKLKNQICKLEEEVQSYLDEKMHMAA